MTISVYIAARWETKDDAARLRDALAQRGIGCTSRWLDEGPSASSLGDFLTDPKRAFFAAQNEHDVKRAQALVFWNPEELAKVGTGGCHWECGFARAMGMPIFLVGSGKKISTKDGRFAVVPDPMPEARSNIFHFGAGIRSFTWPHHLGWLVDAIKEACVDVDGDRNK